MTYKEMALALDRCEADCVHIQAHISRVRYAIEDRHIGRRVGLDYEKNEKKLVADKLLSALKNVLAEASGSLKSCGHSYTCVCTMKAAQEAISEAEKA